MNFSSGKTLSYLMKSFLINFLSATILFCSHAFAQENSDDPKLLFTSEKTNCENLRLDLDSLFHYLSENPGSSGYIVIYGGKNPVQNVFYENEIKSYTRFRKFDENHYSVMNAKSDDELRIETWVSKNMEKPGVEEHKFSYTLPGDIKSLFFATDSLQLTKENGKLGFFGWGCEICCLEFLDLNLLSNFLRANPGFNAQLTFYSRTRKEADEIAKIVWTEAERDFKISRNRITINYGGKNILSSPELKSVADVKVLLVPQKK